jgi:modulator of FtsH protease
MEATAAFSKHPMAKTATEDAPRFGLGAMLIFSLRMPALSEWQTLFALQAGAAATLTGLVFVAVSINLARILAFAGLPSRAAESIIQFLQVFFICTAVLIPRQPPVALAVEVLAIALLSWVIQIVGIIRYSRSRVGHPRLWLIIRIVQTQLASAPLLVGGVCLLLDSPAGLYWLVAGFAFSFVAGVANAWVLLVEVAR